MYLIACAAPRNDVLGVLAIEPLFCHNDLRASRNESAAAVQCYLKMSSYFFSTPVDIDIVLEDADDRQTVDVKLDKNRREKAQLYMDGESVKGAVTVRPKDGRRLEHTGIKVQFIGLIGRRRPT